MCQYAVENFGFDIGIHRHPREILKPEIGVGVQLRVFSPFDKLSRLTGVAGIQIGGKTKAASILLAGATANLAANDSCGSIPAFTAPQQQRPSPQ